MNGRSCTWNWLVIGFLLLLPVISIFAQGSLNKGGNGTREIMELEALIDEGFETDYPANYWTRNAGGGSYTWGRASAQVYEGSNAIWCARENVGGAPRLYPLQNGYANDMDAWTIVGKPGTAKYNIDLRNCASAELSFYVYHKIANGDHFYVYANPGGAGWKGVEYTGQSGGWVKKSINLANWPGHGNLLGQSSVQFAFYFKSNGTVVAEGVYVDNVVLERDFLGWSDLVISTMTFSPSAQEVGGNLSITGTVTNQETNASTGTKLNVYISEDQTISTEEDILLGSIPVPGLSGGGSTNFSQSFFVPVCLPLGSYYIGGFVDPNNDVPEEDDDNNTIATTAMFTAQQAQDYVTLFTDDFEGNYPGGSWVREAQAGDYSWGTHANNVIGYEGEKSIWCAKERYNNAPKLTPETGYANGMSAWSKTSSLDLTKTGTIGTIDLTGATAGDVSFYVWTNQASGDKTEVLANFGQGWDGFEFTGATDGWEYQQLNLTTWQGHGNLIGNNSVSIAFKFSSNATGTTPGGAFIDNVVIRKLVPGSGTAVQDKTVPTEFKLNQNNPNPFNPSTTITYTLPKAADVRLTVYNIFGQEVCQLVNKNVNAGRHSVTWDGSDFNGRQVSSGVYFYRLKAGNYTAMKKMILVE